MMWMVLQDSSFSHLTYIWTGREEGGVDDFQQGKTMKVPVWDFETVVKSFLLDPILFGNPDNLVNSNACPL
jgi:hypothetical protein